MVSDNIPEQVHVSLTSDSFDNALAEAQKMYPGKSHMLISTTSSISSPEEVRYSFDFVLNRGGDVRLDLFVNVYAKNLQEAQVLAEKITNTQGLELNNINFWTPDQWDRKDTSRYYYNLDGKRGDKKIMANNILSRNPEEALLFMKNILPDATFTFNSAYIPEV